MQSNISELFSNRYWFSFAFLSLSIVTMHHWKWKVEALKFEWKLVLTQWTKKNFHQREEVFVSVLKWNSYAKVVTCSRLCSPHDTCSILNDSSFLHRLHIRRHLHNHRWYLEIGRCWCWPLWSSDHRYFSYFTFEYNIGGIWAQWILQIYRILQALDWKKSWGKMQDC